MLSFLEFLYINFCIFLFFLIIIPLLSSKTIIGLFMNVMTIMVDKVCLDFPIAQMYLDGKVVAEYDNIRDAEKSTGIPYS